ncbi:homocysteine S-methyltransferase family protein [candidate division WOR-3 bacterium]|nr:homocysteine S-methyltransferase family protein [candidate division WOR-3 bacterium]
MNKFLKTLNKRKFLFDGGMGTMLISKGLSSNEVPETWNLKHPEIIQTLHHEYLKAGADVIETNTFGANRIKLSLKGLGKEIEKINKRAVELITQILPQEKYIAGDIGPTGKLLKPVGQLDPTEAEQSFAEQAAILAKAGVHLFIIETMYSLKEALIALKAVKNTTQLPVIVSLTYKATPRGFFTVMGDNINQSFELLKNEGADVVGANCTIGSREMVELVKLMKKSVDIPIIAQPNAGNPELKGTKVVYKETPEEFAYNGVQMFNYGANIVGGCCGTTPEFIKRLYENINKI